MPDIVEVTDAMSENAGCNVRSSRSEDVCVSNTTSPYQCLMASHDINTKNNTNPAAHSLNIIPTKFGTLTVNSFPSTLAQVAKV